MNTQIKLVARQTYRTHIKTFGFWALVLSPLLIGLFIAGFAWIMSATDNDETPTLAVVQQSHIQQGLEAQKLDLDLVTVDSVDEAQKQLKAGDIDGYLTVKDEQFTVMTSADANATISEESLRQGLTQIQMAQRAQALNLTGEQVANLQAPVDLSIKTQGKRGESSGGALAQAANNMIATLMGIVIFIFLTTYSGIIAREIANEKSSRIMEILLAATSAKTQFYGKLLGVFGLAVTHMAVYGIAAVLVRFVGRDNDMVKMISDLLKGVDTTFVVFTLIFMLVGIAMYLTLSAIVAALVNDQSQVQQATQPVVYLSMVGYLLSFMVASQPNNTMVQVLSYVPFVSQTLMPARLSLEYATLPQGLVALVLAVVALGVVLHFGEKVYKRNVLSYSDESMNKQLMKMFKRGR
jgi:ABC-2 type transport system permease protein